LIDFVDTLTALAVQRPIFHSEADFQHAFAWEVHQRLPTASIRLEFPLSLPHLDDCLHLDVRIERGSTVLAIELKYKTRDLTVQIDDDAFALTYQGAQLIGRHDFIKDIWRLEQAISVDVNATGYAIMLTNDSAYWKQPGDRHVVDPLFRLHEGNILHGTLDWDARASAGTKRGRDEPIRLNGIYTMRWRDYSKPSTESYGKFRYLAVEVGR
jgi:hypothetical protein